MTHVEFGKALISIDHICDLALGQAAPSLSQEGAFRERIEAGAAVLKSAWQGQIPAAERVYGVTTGVGASVVRAVPEDLIHRFSRNLARMHGCGMGAYLSPSESAAVLAVRLSSLVRGYSGVSWTLLERLCQLLAEGAYPRIPEEGSVGASGDLTPLSYLAANLMGERDMYFRGDVWPAAKVLSTLGMAPLELNPKEGLAIMNGTAVMTALICLNHRRAQRLIAWSTRVAAIITHALGANQAHFDPRIFRAKPYPGQAAVAAAIAADLGYGHDYQHDPNLPLQDTYAIRCTPHIVGVLADALPWMQNHIEIEVNSANDNPLVDPQGPAVLHGGNFYGGHMAFVADSMKNAVANVADLLDRQLHLLVDERTNRGLPANLSGAEPDELPINHGFKALQIATSAWAAEACKLTMPASVFSRSTESHNQDKVSMGTISARDARRVLDLTEQVLVATLLGATQALELKLRASGQKREDLPPALAGTLLQVRKICPFIARDRPLEPDLRNLISALDDGRLNPHEV